MSYSTTACLKPAAQLSKQELKEILLSTPAHEIARDGEFLRKACQLVVLDKLSDPAVIRNVFQLKASNSQLRSADKWPLPSMTKRVELVQHFHAIAAVIPDDPTAFLRDGEPSTGNKPLSRQPQYARPEGEQGLQDWLRMAEERLLP